MKSFWQYLAGILFGIGAGIIGTYYFGVSGKYVNNSTPLTLLTVICGLNFAAAGLIIAIWRFKRNKQI